MSDDRENTQTSDWDLFLSRIKELTVTPFQHVPFVFFAFLALIVFGGLGIWMELILDLANTPPENPSAASSNSLVERLIVATLTYFPAIAGPACFQLTISESGPINKSIRMFGGVLICIFFIALVLLVVLSKSYSTHVLYVGL